MPTPTTDQIDQALGYTEAQAAARAALTAGLIASATQQLTDFTDWYSDLAVTELGAYLAWIVESAQRFAAEKADAYLAFLASTLSGKTVQPVGPIDVFRLRTDAPLNTTYEWLARQYRRDRANGMTDPLPRVLDRAEVMVGNDVARAGQYQARRFAERTPKAIGTRRLIHPELSKSGVCGLCLAASDRLYSVRTLLPLHNRCKCEPIVVMQGADPGSALNDASLQRLYRDAGGTGRAGLKRVRYKVVDTAGTGPRLVQSEKYTPRKPGPRFEGPKPLDAWSKEQLQHQLGLTRSLPDSPWKTAQITRLKRSLARVS